MNKVDVIAVAAYEASKTIAGECTIENPKVMINQTIGAPAASSYGDSPAECIRDRRLKYESVNHDIICLNRKRCVVMVVAGVSNNAAI